MGAARLIPVAIAGHDVGRIELAGRRDGRPYSEADVSSLRAAGERVAAATLSLDPPRRAEKQPLARRAATESRS
jgi:hypothetical protein